MTDPAQIVDAFDARVQRRGERREFFKAVLGTAAVGAGFAFASEAAAQAVNDADILNFALNLEYLEAQFYSYAANGVPLPASSLTGTGTQGAVSLTGAAPPRQVDFTGEPLIRQYALEIAQDEINHVNFLRTALGANAVAQPAINISGDANGSFTAVARAAGVVGATGTFDPYSSPDNFLLGAFLFEDVGVTAYKGASPLITNNTFLDAAAGILAVEAFHSGIIRGTLTARGYNATNPRPALITQAGQFSDARDSVDGTSDLDQGIAAQATPFPTAAGTSTGTGSNFVPTDANGITFSRTTGQVLNIVYLNRNAVSLGGFFPAGVNGSIRTSAAN